MVVARKSKVFPHYTLYYSGISIDRWDWGSCHGGVFLSKMLHRKIGLQRGAYHYPYLLRIKAFLCVHHINLLTIAHRTVVFLKQVSKREQASFIATKLNLVPILYSEVLDDLLSLSSCRSFLRRSERMILKLT